MRIPTTILTFALFGTAVGVVAPQEPPAAPRHPSTGQASSPAEQQERQSFAPGVRIDWKRRNIEVDAHVVLREGPLELLACSPQTREHESIIVVSARPIHIFQAMGLVGLEPGAPVDYDHEKDTWSPPRGQPVRLSIRYQKNNDRVTVPAEKWLRLVESKQSPGPMDWIFAGSRTWPDGRFGADLDGTVVCVVDFETALVAVRDLHSADNELLWLEANTDEIPPLGTPCTLVVEAAERHEEKKAKPVREETEKRPEPHEGGHADPRIGNDKADG